MREIKFRGKDIFSGKWLYGAYIPTEFTQWREPSIFDGHHRAEVDCETLGQYTGLMDCKEREIYEGDILTLDCNPEYFRFGEHDIVEWSSCGWRCRNPHYGRDMSLYDALCTDKLYVIGNIHDNPELLEETK